MLFVYGKVQTLEWNAGLAQGDVMYLRSPLNYCRFCVNVHIHSKLYSHVAVNASSIRGDCMPNLLKDNLIVTHWPFSENSILP